MINDGDGYIAFPPTTSRRSKHIVKLHTRAPYTALLLGGTASPQKKMLISVTRYLPVCFSKQFFFLVYSLCTLSRICVSSV